MLIAACIVGYLLSAFIATCIEIKRMRYCEDYEDYAMAGFFGFIWPISLVVIGVMGGFGWLAVKLVRKIEDE